MIRWILFITFYVVLDWYAFQALKTVTKSTWIYWIYWLVSLLVFGNLIYHVAIDTGQGSVLTPIKSYAFGFFLALIVPKLVLVTILFTEDIVRVPQAVYSYFTEGNREKGYFPSRRKFISSIALGIAAIPFASLLYGMFKGKYNFRVLSYTLEFDDLPDAFDGYQLTQISDIHSGSFDNKEKIAYAVNLVNEQKSDVILFTGDMVNNTASEMEPWKDTFAKLTAKDGVFSVLGNHDYGDYVQWESKEAKAANLQRLKDIQKEMGFNLLLNETAFLEKEGQRLALIGVENWGAGGFKKAGDLDKAISAIEKNDFKILMSHDPSHWEQQVIQHDHHFHLTLSGHTHGMQFGIEIPGWIKWSPVKWRYKYWAGVYKEMGQYINVNRGFGYLGYPGRVGIWPEITVITLKKAKALG
jgi:hypothetical protein